MTPPPFLGDVLADLTLAMWLEPFTVLLAAFVLGQVLAWTYEFTFSGLSYSRGFSHSVVLVCTSAGVLVLAMQHSLVAGLGLFGVLSMIRFRTDLKTPRDLVFVMGAACVGVACGVNAIATATVGAVVFSCVAIYLHMGPFGSRIRYDGVLRFRVDAEENTSQALAALVESHCMRQTLLSLGEVEGAREHVYQVKFFSDRDRELMLIALREGLGAHDVRLLLQDATAEQ